MVLQISQDEFREILSTFSFLNHGDAYEHKFGNLVTGTFPRIEEYWRLFVVPLTNRVVRNSRDTNNYIGFREGVEPKLKHLASVHYSVFMHLLYAHLHFQKPIESSLENIFTHLATTCDLTETLIERWHLILLQCRGAKSEILQSLTKDQFLERAGEWYDENYKEAFEYYYSKGKSFPIDVPKGKNLLREYFGDSEIRKEYCRFSQKIRNYRNAVVHDVKLAVIEDKGRHFIPRVNKISKYRTWDAVDQAAKNKNIFEADFIEQWQEISDCIEGLEIHLNSLWLKLIQDVTYELFSPDRKTLTNLFNIEFSDTAKVIFEDKGRTENLKENYFSSESGTSQRSDSSQSWKGAGSAIIFNNKEDEP